MVIGMVLGVMVIIMMTPDGAVPMNERAVGLDETAGGGYRPNGGRISNFPVLQVRENQEIF